MSTSFIDRRLFTASVIACVVFLIPGCASTPTGEGENRGSRAAMSTDTPGGIDTVNVIKPVREQAATPEAGRDASEHVIRVPATPEAQASGSAASAEYHQGIRHLQDGQFDQARIVMVRLSERHPSLSGPRVNAGLSWLRQDQPEKAVEQFEMAVKANPSNPYAWNLRGVALKELGRFMDARSSYERAIALDPLYAGAHFNLGVLADLYLQDYELAIRHYETYQSLQRTPDQAVANWIGDLKNRIAGRGAAAGTQGGP